MTIEKARRYAGVLLVLESNNVLSLSLRDSFKQNIIRSCNITCDDFYTVMQYAKKNIHLESSCLFVDWKD